MEVSSLLGRTSNRARSWGPAGLGLVNRINNVTNFDAFPVDQDKTGHTFHYPNGSY
jgi:hypothetical protein